MKETILQKGAGDADLFLYCHIAADAIRGRVKATTSDAVVAELWGQGTSAYKPLLASYGGFSAWTKRLAAECGKSGWGKTSLTCWSAGGQVAKEVCQGNAWPDAIVLLDAVYGTKPAGSRPGDGRVLWDAGLAALGNYALAAARGERILVLFHSAIRTPYASSKECVEAIVGWVEERLGDKLGPDVSVSRDRLDGHGFVEAIAYGGLHVIEFAGIDAAEHITEAHLYDEVWRLWLPWTGEGLAAASTEPPPLAPAPTQASPAALPSGPRVLREGMSGPDVARWQLFLLGLGYLKDGAADGRFGPKTKAATAAFQARAGLTPDGAVGKLTRAAAEAAGHDHPVEPKTTEERGPNFPPPPSFMALTPAERVKVFGSFRYESAPVAGNPEAIRILDDWDDRNIVTVNVPQIAGLRGAPRDGAVRFHRKGADKLLALWDAWESAGLLSRVLSFDGAWVPRFIRGSTTTLSNHAYGSAFDVNAQWNPLGARPKLVGEVGSVRELVPIANEMGWYYGGHYKSRPDGMHFELVKP